MNSKQRRKVQRSHLKHLRRAMKYRGSFFGIDRSIGEASLRGVYVSAVGIPIEEAIRLGLKKVMETHGEAWPPC